MIAPLVKTLFISLKKSPNLPSVSVVYMKSLFHFAQTDLEPKLSAWWWSSVKLSWGLVAGGQALDHCSWEVWSPVLALGNIKHPLLNCNQNPLWPHETCLDVMWNSYVSRSILSHLCAYRTPPAGIVFWQTDRYLHTWGLILWNTMIAARVAVNMVGGT